MRIGMILDNEFTGDLRVENEVTTLQNAGHKVFVICLNFGTKKNREVFNGAEIFRISIPKFIKKKLVGLNNTIFNLYPIFWSIHIKRFITNNKIEVLHVHDLWMLNSAFKANEDFHLPIVSDLHENFVHALNHYRFANTFPGNILISKKRWEKSEIEWTKKADYIITVIEEAVERYIALGIPEEKISVVPNYVNLKSFLSDSIDEGIVNKFKDSFTITYVGGFDVHRGLESTLKAVPKIIKEINNFKLVLVGTGSNFESLVRLSKELNIEDHVSFEGWQPHEKLSSYIKASDVCLIPHLKTIHTDNTIPHKLFQYMIFEKPVVASNCAPLVRIINETGAGVIFKSNDENDLADKIVGLYQNPDLRNKMGKKGKQAVLDKYNWDRAAMNLIDVYRRIEQKVKEQNG
ncbi:Glycosyl transferase, group 1 [hydrothermal vent metagenome]|uniref:Glycosyl transferase, group 1 n=1 Tax=hydrothermal vent metagenome TaxID=652676 RepID=A0A3B1C0N8_9ZZZZ